MSDNRFFKRPQFKPLVALAISLIAILIAPVVFGFGPGTTYNASDSMATFREAIIITLVFYSLSLITRWLVIPGLITSLFGFLAIGTFMLAVVHHGGFGVVIAPLVAFVGLIYAFFCGFGILRKPKAGASDAAST